MSDNCTTYPDSIARAMSEAEAPSVGCSIDQELGFMSSRRRRQRRRQFVCPSKFIALALCCLAANTWSTSHAFSSPSPHSYSRIRSSSPSPKSNNCGYRQERKFFMSSLADRPSAAASSDSSRMTDFQRRMKGLVKRNGAVSGGRRTIGQRGSDKPKNLKTAHTLEEYKEVMDQEKGKMIVVRFYATWCKACKAIQPGFYRMAALYPHVTFLEVPVTNHNANLHQGLDVPSLPYGHIYVPEAGLVEELKISKKYFPNLVKMVRWYDGGECNLDEYTPPVDEAE
mmetsp:Transcript_21849/g.46140  ORF Transcript_21849/g.46140 Transcript_21849/m.46140 type:complete len:283 (-) Transcript_21849:143-991(-)|eukprot:CAMPEP_0183703612 /NCGR_PEP_ID=MMETSP0737-20130205/1301_1 /TAXON_ID=385413 /ORGANISM="Thalassiosira miniscula, Strain CCMP1093" /LENGTH=282 /DNA_ID=CAMNT_0025930403 /DNA_START=306 /DNA_END=1154 /DNA_ORIENTATION=-